jgi:hypothetical protein
MMYNGFVVFVIGRGGDSDVHVKNEIRNVIYNQPWRSWAEKELAEIK